MIHKTGTTIAGICCSDGVVLGADTKSTVGLLVANKHSRKIHLLSRNIYACGCGTSADCVQLARAVKNQLGSMQFDYQVVTDERVPDSVDISARLLSDMMYSNVGGRNPECSFIVGGVDNLGPKLYTVTNECNFDRVSYAALGSGAADALASIENKKFCVRKALRSTSDQFTYHENISVIDGIKIVKEAILSGIRNDLGSGCSVDLCIITANSTTVWRENAFNESMNSTFERL